MSNPDWYMMQIIAWRTKNAHKPKESPFKTWNRMTPKGYRKLTPEEWKGPISKFNDKVLHGSTQEIKPESMIHSRNHKEFTYYELGMMGDEDNDLMFYDGRVEGTEQWAFEKQIGDYES